MQALSYWYMRPYTISIWGLKLVGVCNAGEGIGDAGDAGLKLLVDEALAASA